MVRSFLRTLTGMAVMKLGMYVLIWLAGFWIVSDANAQWYPYAARPVRSLDRWLGVGYSGGYHTSNPGPDSDYYQPYSDLHSGLRSWQPTESDVPQLPEEAPQEWRAPDEFPRGMESGANRGAATGGAATGGAATWPQVGERRQVKAKNNSFGWLPSARTSEAQWTVRAKNERQHR